MVCEEDKGAMPHKYTLFGKSICVYINIITFSKKNEETCKLGSFLEKCE